jgi:hypothetical protein
MSVPAVVPITEAKRSAVDKRRAAALEREREREYKASIDARAVQLDQWEADVASLNADIRALNERKQATLAAIETLESATLDEMREMKAEKLIGNARTLTLHPNPPRLVIEDESKLPREYFKEETVFTPLKLAIKAALTAGEEIAGVKLEQTVSLRRSKPRPV